MKSNLLPIAREGWNYLIGSIVLLLIFKFLNFEFLQFLAFLAMMFFVYVFRNPERQNMLYQENSIVSPVDGTVVSIEELHGEENSGYKVEIEGTYLNVSLLRVPFTSSLEHIEIQRGARLSATSPLSKNINENAELVFADKRSSNKIKIIHKLKQSFETIDIDIIKAQDLLQGTRYGLMINGITTIYLPTNFRLNVGLGSELIASETLIGYFTNESKK
ncbi:phosphatidylserine decarboxylase [Sulfurimonas sp.]|uniref:phosphatidylserine decarboxylase n=1 Tax=Sulfurimonas sp. TaxID=2022749 RepID=UPI00286E8D3B|nr:phosphatidylserine decarboxylase [Sulfurimonas sp.]